jgi:hypothetical protein
MGFDYNPTKRAIREITPIPYGHDVYANPTQEQAKEAGCAAKLI